MRRVSPETTVLIAFAAVAATATQANAQRASATIVLESYDVRRPENADVAMGILRAEFDGLGYVAKVPDVKHQLGNQLALPGSEPPAPSAPTPASGRKKGRSSDPKPPPPNPRASPAALMKELSNAHERFVAAKESFDALKPVLTKAVEDAFASPALIVTDPTIRSKLEDVLLDLTLLDGKLAHDEQDSKKAGALQKESDDWMAEWVRTYGAEDVIQKKQGPDADTQYTRVRDERDKLGRGVLSVTVNDRNVQLYVNETIRSLNHSVPDMTKGVYRALLMGPNDDARLFLPEILPNQTTRLVVDWPVSSNLVVTASSVSFVMPPGANLEPAVLACKLARSVGETGVVLIGLEPVEQSWTATALLYNVQSGQLVRGGYTVLEMHGMDDMQRRLAALALFVASGIRDPDVIVTGENLAALNELTARQRSDLMASSPAAADTAAPATRSSGLGKWFAAGGSAALLALGSASLYRYYTCGTEEDPCKYIYPRAGIVGYGAVGAGVALSALSAYWFYQDANPSSASRVTVAPSRSGAMVRWTMEF